MFNAMERLRGQSENPMILQPNIEIKITKFYYINRHPFMT